MAPCHRFAEQALNILRFLAVKWNIDIDTDDGWSLLPDHDRLVRSSVSSYNMFALNKQAIDIFFDWEVNWGHRQMKPFSKEQQSEEQDLDVSENLRLWPFPILRQPSVPQVENLEAAGFLWL